MSDEQIKAMLDDINEFLSTVIPYDAGLPMEDAWCVGQMTAIVRRHTAASKPTGDK